MTIKELKEKLNEYEFCAALMKIFNGNDFEIFNNPRYAPNISCYRAVLESYFGSYNSEEAEEKFWHNIVVAKEYEGWDD